jgi:iron complex outermembrane recepter protein
VSNQLSWRCVSVGLALVGGAAIYPSQGLAQAQMDLPGVTVTAASPVKRRPVAASAAAQGQGQGEAPPQLPTTPTIIDDVFVPLTLVPEREIVATPGANLADSLQYRPGIAGSTFTPGANRPVVRGLDNYRIRVQENGIGSHDVSALSEDHAVPHRSLRRRSDRGGAGAGHPSLRIAGHRWRGERQQ